MGGIMKSKRTKNDNIKLTMTDEEAGVLLAIALNIGGSRSPRRVVDELIGSFGDVGIKPTKCWFSGYPWMIEDADYTLRHEERHAKK